MKIYLVCAWYEVGMRHYSYAILKNLNDHLPEDVQLTVTLVLRKQPTDYPELKSLSRIVIDYVVIENNALNIASKFFPIFFDLYVYRMFRKLNADMIYILFGGLFFNNLNFLKRRAKILSTIHDLNPHEKSKQGLKDKILSYLENKRDRNLVSKSPYILTNSLTQFNQLSLLKGVDRVFYANMPTFVNENMADGVEIVSELIGIKNYILFFGRIDKYKGLDELIDTHLNSQSDEILVIAGGGKFWFEIPKSNRLIIINRYIKDEELKTLFSDAKICVMPYRNITQTSLTSIPFFFGCPVILSNINEFAGIASEGGSLVCNFSDKSDYLLKINELNNEKVRKDIISKQIQFYKSKYDAKAFTKQLASIFEKVLLD